MSNPTHVYLVVRQGVYPQGTVGIFYDRLKAKEAALAAAAEEPDDYHSFLIYQVPTNYSAPSEAGWEGQTLVVVEVSE